MANTYTFRINAVDVHTSQNDLEKVIYNVHWSYIAQDENGNSASQIGVESLEAPDPENFVAFETLIQSDIITWIEPLLPVEDMQAVLDAKIAEIIAPSKQTLQVPISLEAEETTTEEATAEETV
jgi:hypothetical protein